MNYNSAFPFRQTRAMRARMSPLSREEYAPQRGAIPTDRTACSTHLRNAVRYRLYCAAISLSTCAMISSNRSGRMWSVDRDSRSRRRTTLRGVRAAGGGSPTAGYRCSRVTGSPVPWLPGGLPQRRSMDCIRIKCHQGEGFLYPMSNTSAQTNAWKEASCERIMGTCWISTPGYSKRSGW
jgi:hypothetical protein